MRSVRWLALAVAVWLSLSAASAQAASSFSWSAPALIDGGHQLLGVSCPSASLCVAGDNTGNVVTATNPTGGAGAWTVTNVDGTINVLYGVSCPSASLCVAGDDHGNVVTATNPAGGAGAWTVSHVDGTNAFRGVSCPSASLCVAVDNHGNVVTATNPAGGAGAWTVANVDGSNLFFGVSCASASLCVAVDDHGNVVTTTNPTGGASAWAANHVDGTTSILGISCPSTSLCVAGDSGGNFLTPASFAWTVTNVDTPNSLWSVSCPSTSLCVAGDSAGNIVTTTNPTGGAGAWTVTNVDATNALYGVSCPSASLCVGVDGVGNVLTGSGPPSVSTDQATAVGQSSATLAGSVNPNGLAVTDCHFDYGPSTSYASSIPCSPAPGSGTSSGAVSARISNLAPAMTYHFRLVATNAAGTALGADQSFTTTPGTTPPPSSTPPAGSTPPPGSTPPAGAGKDVISNFMITPQVLVAASRGAPVAVATVSTARKTGAIVSYSGTQAATTTFSVQRRVAGRAQGRSCVKPSNRNRTHKRCTRWVNIGGFTHTDIAGTNRFRFTGRVRGHKLKPGEYRLQAIPRNAAGAGPAAYMTFRVKT